MSQRIPLNCAETIIDPLCDSDLSGLSHWKVRPAKPFGLTVQQVWCWVAFEWMSAPAEGPVLSTRRTSNTKGSRYDTLLASISAGIGSTVRLIAETDKGECSSTSLPVSIDDAAVTITGAKGVVSFAIPDGCTARVEEINPDVPEWPEHRRITLHHPERSGVIDIVVKLKTR